MATNGGLKQKRCRKPIRQRLLIIVVLSVRIAAAQ
jgi:hypothetical protein